MPSLRPSTGIGDRDAHVAFGGVPVPGHHAPSILVLCLALLVAVALPAHGADGDPPGQGAPGTRAERPATAAEVRALVDAWMPHLLQAGGGSEDLSAELRNAASNATATEVALARTMRTFPGVMAALHGDPDGDRDVMEEAVQSALESGDGRVVIKAFGDIDRDLLYVPVAPCRIVDTRVAGGQIAAGTSRGFDVTAVGGSYAFQGGATDNCGGVGAAGNFAAAVLTLTVPAAAASGSLTAFAFGATQPSATSLEFPLGQSVSNTTVVRLDQGPAANELSVATTANAHVVIDIVGYFTNPAQPILECVTTAENTASVAAGGSDDVFAPACPTGYGETATYCEASSYLMPMVFISDGACSARNNGSSSATLRASRRCCRTRIP